eukprot:CAMPEP_0175707690 /NCGR_PEP_ID=MMETSP0097-20121207/38687_1 /TAXON_ID=311494 /ORGANISM="Alexandrium monilatum, Strain CCMP3105" /LENGTH=695 /DNA_ID=CAMNT_0017015067 /DNA_START=98 /DNA_END=2183 /DNA_ORIENTATION=+
MCAAVTSARATLEAAGHMRGCKLAAPAGGTAALPSRTCLPLGFLVDETWARLLQGLLPKAAGALRAAAVWARNAVDEASLLLLARRFRAAALPRIRPPLASLALWRARPGASHTELAAVAALAAEWGLVEFLLEVLAANLGGVAEVLLLADNQGVTALHAAASAGQAAVCRALCSAAARSVAGAGGTTEQARGPRSELEEPWRGVVDALMRRTAKGRTVLHCAAARGDPPTLRALLDAVPHKPLQDLLAQPDRRQRPCALLACLEGRAEAARLLVGMQESFASGAAREAGAALLAHACETGSASLARALLEKEADPNLPRGSDGVSPLAAAVVGSSLQVLEVLVRHPRLDPALAERRGGRGALHLACQLGHTSVVSFLVSHRADAAAMAPGGRTPLYVAAEHGCLGAVKALLHSGQLAPADVLRENSRHATPLSVAQRRAHRLVVDELMGFIGQSLARQPSWCASPSRSSSRGPGQRGSAREGPAPAEAPTLPRQQGPGRSPSPVPAQGVRSALHTGVAQPLALAWPNPGPAARRAGAAQSLAVAWPDPGLAAAGQDLHARLPSPGSARGPRRPQERSLSARRIPPSPVVQGAGAAGTGQGQRAASQEHCASARARLADAVAVARSSAGAGSGGGHAAAPAAEAPRPLEPKTPPPRRSAPALGCQPSAPEPHQPRTPPPRAQGQAPAWGHRAHLR